MIIGWFPSTRSKQYGFTESLMKDAAYIRATVRCYLNSDGTVTRRAMGRNPLGIVLDVKDRQVCVNILATDEFDPETGKPW